MFRNNAGGKPGYLASAHCLVHAAGSSTSGTDLYQKAVEKDGGSYEHARPTPLGLCWEDRNFQAPSDPSISVEFGVSLG
jgi:hypothetical protein